MTDMNRRKGQLAMSAPPAICPPVFRIQRAAMEMISATAADSMTNISKTVLARSRQMACRRGGDNGPDCNDCLADSPDYADAYEHAQASTGYE